MYLLRLALLAPSSFNRYLRTHLSDSQALYSLVLDRFATLGPLDASLSHLPALLLLPSPSKADFSPSSMQSSRLTETSASLICLENAFSNVIVEIFLNPYPLSITQSLALRLGKPAAGFRAISSPSGPSQRSCSSMGGTAFSVSILSLPQITGSTFVDWKGEESSMWVGRGGDARRTFTELLVRLPSRRVWR